MATVLENIITGVREDLTERINNTPLEEIQRQAQNQKPALEVLNYLRTQNANTFSVIAEVKRASPSKGELGEIHDPAALAQAYERGGASVISVLTEQRRFKGTLNDLKTVREHVNIPILRKDFIIDEYQIWEARAYGADLILLIVAALDDQTLKEFLELTHKLGMRALIETHTPEEIERAKTLGAHIIGVNVRNLKTLDVNNAHFAELAQLLPQDAVIIAESGVSTAQDVTDYALHGAQAVLVGEALVRSGEPENTVREFKQAGHTGRTQYLQQQNA
ncbi:indole-3-glycerol phosphate synthase TrpC [Rothia sp. P13129]|uniref:indole-3-glycerol phosphate synthase TrpC n=1 Tax=unclassified Rothia (in: high G+C Gram-positive bacteria) TaxID=2689056 RepID=UPI003ACBF5B8